MTKIVCISDTHGKEVPDMPDGDILVHTGDYCSRGTYNEFVRFLEWLEFLKPKYKHIVCISGNHDRVAESEPDLVATNFAEAGITYLNDSGATIEGLKFWGSPVSPEFCNWAFNRNQLEIEEHWNLIPDDTQILLTHCGPFGILDKLSKFGSEPGAHVGCRSLNKTIFTRLHSLKLNVYGHLHESYGIERDAKYGVAFVNASSLNEHYQQTNRPIMVNL